MLPVGLVLLASVMMTSEHGAGSSGLTLTVYDNTGRTANGNTKITTIPSSAFSVSADGGPFSADLSGTLTFAEAGIYAFNCTFLLTSTAWVWVDGHLVCQDGHAYTRDTGSIHLEPAAPI